MRRLLAFNPWLNSGNDLGLVQDRVYNIGHSPVTTLKVHPNRDIFVAGGEDGSLFLFDTSTDTDAAKQRCILSYKYGGVSEICWIGDDLLAVGTTRGRIVTFSINNEKRYMLEVASVKAHGDGAAQIAVDGLDYSPTSRCLVSVAEGVGSIKLWSLSDKGQLDAKVLPVVTTAYTAPRYVTFLEGGSKLLVGFMENSLVQIFRVEPFAMIQDVMIGRDDSDSASQMGNALVLEKAEKLAIFNWHGQRMYDLTTMTSCTDSVVRTSPMSCFTGCNQGLASLKAGTFLVSVAGIGFIELWRATDGVSMGTLKVPGKNRIITAIHAATSTHQDILVAASIHACNKEQSTLSVWRSTNRHPTKNYGGLGRGQQLSTLQLALLCITICIAFQVIAIALPWPLVITRLSPRHDEAPPHNIQSDQAVEEKSTTLSMRQSHEPTNFYCDFFVTLVPVSGTSSLDFVEELGAMQ